MTDPNTDALKKDLTYWSAAMVAVRKAAAGELRSYEVLTLLRYLEWMTSHPQPPGSEEPERRAG